MGERNDQGAVIMMMTREKWRRSALRTYAVADGGATAVEFGLILPVLITFIFAAMQLNELMFRSASVQWALDRAARTVVTDPDATVSQIEAKVKYYLESAGSPDVDIHYANETTANVPIAKLTASYTHLVRGPFIPEFTINFQFHSLVPKPDAS